MKFEAIKHKDVKGKELLYVKVTANGKEHVINVGQKTFDAVAAILESKLEDNNKLHELTEEHKGTEAGQAAVENMPLKDEIDRLHEEDKKEGRNPKAKLK